MIGVVVGRGALAALRISMCPELSVQLFISLVDRQPSRDARSKSLHMWVEIGFSGRKLSSRSIYNDAARLVVYVSNVEVIQRHDGGRCMIWRWSRLILFPHPVTRGGRERHRAPDTYLH